jgi:hypothetical protein
VLPVSLHADILKELETMDYSKWDKLEVEEEEDETRTRVVQSVEAEKLECRRELQKEIDRWLEKQIRRLPRDGSRSSSYASTVSRIPPTPIRQVTKEEREVLSMLIVLSHFEEGQTNLDRHPQMLDIVRQNRWIEEDAGSLELLCRVHNMSMQPGDPSEARYREEMRTEEEKIHSHRMNQMTLCAINTIAAPAHTKCSGGLLELFNKICTPETEETKELRKKWQKKEFGKDAIMDSLFPDMRKSVEEAEMDDGLGSDFWIILALGLLAIIGIIAFVVLYYNSPIASSKTTTNVVTAGANATMAAGTHLTTSTTSLSEQLLTPPAPPPPPAVQVCKDSDNGCQAWAEMGECEKNAEFMLANCKLSCRVCKVFAPAPPPRGSDASDSPKSEEL